ncbi:hypothetical protein EIK77_007479 [Talaromyces pinophilus]|nr:hypothetical protein EIK77_007479 [Talaromyces pinophilus]
MTRFGERVPETQTSTAIYIAYKRWFTLAEHIMPSVNAAQDFYCYFYFFGFPQRRSLFHSLEDPSPNPNMSDFTENLRPCQPDGASTLMLERSQSSLPVEELANYLLNQDGFLDRQKIILPILEKEALLSKTGQQNLSRPDRFKLGLARAKLLRRLADQHGWSNEDYRIAQYLVDEMSPFALQMDMFLTTVRQQASDEQQKQWIPLIDSWKIIGAYAQTELGHGSNVRGLELQAKWDPRTKEFILHSPTLTASKWWNGSLGRTANYAIVVAQLLLPKRSPASQSQETEYISYGPHPFMVQVRDLETHQPLQGIVIGDIGPKYGYMSMDNGYMLFDNFR